MLTLFLIDSLHGKYQGILNFKLFLSYDILTDMWGGYFM